MTQKYDGILFQIKFMLLNNIIQLKSCIAFYSNYIDNDHPPNACVPAQLLQSCWTLRP